MQSNSTGSKLGRQNKARLLNTSKKLLSAIRKIRDHLTTRDHFVLEIKEALNGEGQARAEGWHPGEIKCGSTGWPGTKLGSRKSLLADERRLPGEPDVWKLAKHQLSKSMTCFLSRLTYIISHVRGKTALAAFPRDWRCVNFSPKIWSSNREYVTEVMASPYIHIWAFIFMYICFFLPYFLLEPQSHTSYIKILICLTSRGWA